MRKLILLTQTSVDGYLADEHGKTDWMIWNWGEEWRWDSELRKLQEDISASVDTVLISRQMAEEGFVHHWADFAMKKDNLQHRFAQSIVDAKKIVFSKTLETSIWGNTVLAQGDIVTEVNKLKAEEGNSMIVYGGSTLVSSLIQEGLIDEFYLIVNPVAIGSGLPVFKSRQQLSLVSATVYGSGITVLKYLKSA